MALRVSTTVSAQRNYKLSTGVLCNGVPVNQKTYAFNKLNPNPLLPLSCPVNTTDLPWTTSLPLIIRNYTILNTHCDSPQPIQSEKKNETRKRIDQISSFYSKWIQTQWGNRVGVHRDNDEDLLTVEPIELTWKFNLNTRWPANQRCGIQPLR